MLTLGEVLALARRSAGLERLGLPPDLLDRLKLAAAEEGETPEAFARIAAAEFAEAARPEEWTRLMSRLRDSADPGAACLALMIERSLAARKGARPAPVVEEPHGHAENPGR